MGRLRWGQFLALAAILLLPLLAACGGEETLAPDKVLEQSKTAMQAATSFHFALATSALDKPLAGLFVSKADGDIVKPDKLAGSVTAIYSGIPLNLKVVVVGQNQFMTDPASGQWTSSSSILNISQYFDPNKGVSDILASVQNVTGDGKETIDGTDSYRLKGTVPATALKSLSSEVTATGNITTTLWIGSGDFLLRQARLEGPLIADEPANIVRTFNFKDYNKDIKIETPVVGQP